MIMKYTSSEANKLLKKLNETHAAISKKEGISKEFLASIGEDIECIRPQYDFTATNIGLYNLNEQIRKVKHAINLFNVQTVIPEFDITIDEALVLIPQLTQLKTKYASMKDKLPKMREQGMYSRNNSIVEYRYLNYDIQEVEKEYEKVSERLTKLQTALDIINTTCCIEIEIEI